MKIRQSVVVPAVKPEAMPLATFCREVATIGFEAVECWGGIEEVTDLLRHAREHGLGVSSMMGHGDLQTGLNRTDQHDRIENELRETLTFAADNGIPGVLAFSGTRVHGQSDLEGMVTCARGLRRIARLAEDLGVNINVEILNSKVDHAGYLCDRVDWALGLCEMVRSPNVRILFDLYHVQIMEGDVVRNLQRAIGAIGHFHTAGNPGRHELDDLQEMNYRGICKAIAQTGYSHYVAHEFMPRGDAVAALKQAFSVCDQE